MHEKKGLTLFFIGTMMLLGGIMQTVQSEQENTELNSAKNSVLAEADTSDMFSDRDKEVGYEETESIAVQLSDDGSSCESDFVVISENTVTIKDEGTYILSGTLTDGMVIVEAEDTDKIQIVLDNVTISNPRSAALYVRSADKVFVTTKAELENTLQNGGTYSAIDENNIDAAVFSKSDLTFNGEGILNITADAGHGIVSKDDLVFTCGNYQITSAEHGISGRDSVRIANGLYTIVSGKDGIHGDAGVTISGGSIEIEQSYEGMEGLSIDISGGEISILALDGGINAAGGNDSSGFEGFGPGKDQFASTEGAYICISGGRVEIDASGDGIDSNGDITVSGGETYLLKAGEAEESIYMESTVYGNSVQTGDMPAMGDKNIKERKESGMSDGQGLKMAPGERGEMPGNVPPDDEEHKPEMNMNMDMEENATAFSLESDSYIIENFPILEQMPELPTGCEITAMTMALNYYGYEADKIQMAEKYLPQIASADIYVGEDGILRGNDLNQYFIGNPTTSNGTICGTGAIVTAANAWLLLQTRLVVLLNMRRNSLKLYLNRGEVSV